MDIKQVRHFFGPKYTISKVYINGVYFCDAIEDTDRGLTSDMEEEEILKRKVYGETAIPYGSYEISISMVSPRFSQKAIYNRIQGKLPRLLNVKGYDGVLVHIGNTEKDTAGCIIVGRNKAKGMVSDSSKTFFDLYIKMQRAKLNGEKIVWHVVKQ